MSARGGSRVEACPGGHIGPPLRGYRKRSGTNGNCPETMPCPAGRDGARPLQGAEQACGGGVRLGCGHPALRKQGRWCVVTARRGRRALRVQCKWYPAYGPMWASAPTESPINHPSQPARSEASAPAAARNGRESALEPSKRDKLPRLPGQRLAKRKARKEQLVKFDFCPMTSECSTAYKVRKPAKSPARALAGATLTEQDSLAPHPAARQGAPRP